MSRSIKIFLIAALIIVAFTQDKICEHLGFGQSTFHGEDVETVSRDEVNESKSKDGGDYFVSDTIYRWDAYYTDWVPIEDKIEAPGFYDLDEIPDFPDSKPIEIEWETLLDVEYKQRYFSELEMTIYAPVFTKELLALHKKKVIITGFVIPFDLEENLLALSRNPYASCFFCGQASPASVISLYLKNNDKRYKTDDYKTFSGTLYLNEDDPADFYYILREAKEIKS